MKKSLSILAVSLILANAPAHACIQPNFDKNTAKAYDFIDCASSNSPILAKQGDKYGYLDGNGNIIVPFVYDQADAFYDHVARVSKDGRKFVIIYQNGQINSDFDDVGAYYNDMRAIVKGDAIGIIDKAGNIIIPPEYQKTHEPAYFRHEIFDNKSYFFVKKDGKAGVIDSNHQIIVPFVYQAISPIYDGHFVLVNDGHNIGLLDLNNPQQYQAYDDVEWHDKDGYFITMNHALLGAYSESKNIDIDIGYKYLQRIDDTHFLAQTNGKFGMIDNQGKPILPFEYEDIGMDLRREYQVLIDEVFKYQTFQKDEQILRFVLSALSELPVADVKKDGKVGLVNLATGQVVVPASYDDVAYVDKIHSNRAVVKKDGKFGLIDSTNGRQITPIIYDSMKIGNDNSVVFQQNAVFGWMDYEGKVLRRANGVV